MTSDGGVGVLCVDDDPRFVDVIADVLRREDDRFAIETATNASDALARLEEGGIDCVVSDYDMPETDGIDLLRAVRENHADLPFILFTGKGSEDVAQEAIEAGVTSYLQKGGGTAQYAVLANRIDTHVEQYRTEQRAADLEREYELVAQTATDAFWKVDLSTETISFSDGIRHFGYDPEEVPDEREWFFEQVHPEDRTRMRRHDAALFDREEELFDRLSDERGRFSTEYRFQRADGSYATCRERGVVLFEDGDPVEMIGTMTDVTERKEREEMLRRYETVVDAMQEGVFMVGTDGTYIFVDDIASGPCAPEEWIGRPVSALSECEAFDEETVEEYRESVERILRGERDRTIQTVTLPALDRPGETHLEAHLSAVTNDDDELLGVVGTTRDVTARIEQRRKLERQNERLKEFAGFITHDLRNPLTTAQGYLELAQEDGSPEHFEHIGYCLDRMERIIEDVHWLARSGQDIRTTERVDLADLIEESWNTVAGHEDLAELAIDGRPPLIDADPDRLRQLLENLFGNAIEHGGSDVTVRVETFPDGFAIADDGPGIPEADREHVFEQGYSTAKDGTGLGLAIVREITQAHGWKIDVTESTAGGARFEITGVTSASEKE